MLNLTCSASLRAGGSGPDIYFWRAPAQRRKDGEEERRRIHSRLNREL